MSEEKKPPIILAAGAGEKLARNDGGALAREIAARSVEEARQKVLEAATIAQKHNSDQKEGLNPAPPTTRAQRRAEAAKLREIAERDEKERAKLVRIIHKKAKAAGLPFQHYVQRMMDSGLENLVEMAKIIRRIK
jgi:hypothetical protein